jgi:hypothetical protein
MYKGNYIILILIILLSAIPAHSGQYPHTVAGLSSSDQINCKDCHEFHGDPSWGTGGVDLDNTYWNKLCYSCHNDVIAPSRAPHSSLQTDTSYGNWAVECKTCHDPHEHEQIGWGASSYLYSSTVSNVLIDTPVAGQSTIVDASPSWTDGEFDASGDDFFVVAGDVNDLVDNVYKVISNSGSNLVVEGTVDTTKTSAGDTFAIILGKLVRSTVVLDQIVTYTGVSTSVTSNSITESGAGWTPDQFVGLKLIPNAKLLNPIAYDITSNTSDTIYVSGTFSANAGDPFQVVGGIAGATPVIKSGNKSVRFFNRTGTNSFADGDTTYDGICEVCHTQTTYHRNNSSGNHTHNAGTQCTQCHDHTSGFKGAGDCISCHSTQQGTSRRDVSPDFAKTSHHVSTGMPTDVLTCMACHGNLLADRGHPGSATTDPITELEDADTAGTYYTIDPSTSDANLATFCISCHDSDGASRLGANAMQPFADSGDTTAPPNIASAWGNTYNHSANATCNDCHGDNAAAGTTLDPKYNLHGSSNSKILREATEYDTCVTSGCHGSGGSATTDMTVELSGTGGKHPIGSAVTPNSTTLQGDTNGDLFVNGWTKDSVAQCSDCHGMNQAGTNNVGPRGPHGSAYQFMLRGVDSSINTVTSGRAYGTPTNADAAGEVYAREAFCINCHASDVYGIGLGGTAANRTAYVPSNNNLSYILHYSTFKADRCGNPDGASVGGTNNQVGSKQKIGCTNCHAGAGWNYGGHSSTGPLGKGNGGFVNGNSWDNSTPPGTRCYTGSGGAGATWNTCTKGDHGGY